MSCPGSVIGSEVSHFSFVVAVANHRMLAPRFLPGVTVAIFNAHPGRRYLVG
jgi:hypothetical protein